MQSLSDKTPNHPVPPTSNVLPKHSKSLRNHRPNSGSSQISAMSETRSKSMKAYSPTFEPVKESNNDS